MSKNKIHCIFINTAINKPKNLKPTLSGLFGPWEGKVVVETIDENSKTLSSLIKKLINGNISVLFIGSSENKTKHAKKKEPEELKIEQYKNLLRRYSIDTILVSQSIQNSPLKRDLSGIEYCSISLKDRFNSPVFIKNLLRYTQLKKDFRISKHLLSITDKRNRWLVNITQEPIAYLYKGAHIHANAAYLSLFGFQSMPELKSSNIWDLVPEKSHKMFKKFIKRQRKYSNVKTDMQQTMLMSMHTIDKAKIRASIRIAPAVINKTQCLQIWIHKIEENLVPKIDSKETPAPVSPWENLPEKRTKSHNHQDSGTALTNSNVATKLHRKKNVTSFNQLRQSLTSVKLKLQPLTDTKTSDINHYFAKLQFDALEQSKIAKQLEKSTDMDTGTFWDRILLIEFIKKLRGNQQVGHKYLLSLGATSVNSNHFISFLVKALETLPKKHPLIIFLLPHQLFVDHNERMMKIKNLLQPMNGSLGIYNFVPDKRSLQIILKDKPAYVSFSSKWVQSLQGNNNKLEKLSRLTDLLEDAGIQIILS